MEITASLQIKNNTYQAVLSYKEGIKWKTKWKSTGIKAQKGNKKKAENMLDKIKTEFQEKLNNNDIARIEEDDILFLDFMSKWLSITKYSVEQTTYVSYKKLINGRITKYFKNKNITLQNIKPYHIQDFYQYLNNNHLSGNTIKHYHANIRKALQYAVKTDLIPYNPADRVELPRIYPYNAKFYTDEEISLLLNVVKGTKLETPVILGCFYGLRRSEILGLKWSAIDFKNKTISINHIVTQITGYSSNNLIQKDRTKTKSSTRTLPLLAPIESYLLELKEKQKHNKSIFGDCYNQDYLEYICVDVDGRILNPDYISHTFRKLLKKNNLKLIRFHDLRHSCASLLLANGISIKEIQTWLGHSNYNTTAQIYAHLSSNGLEHSAEVISNILTIKKEVAYAPTKTTS